MTDLDPHSLPPAERKRALVEQGHSYRGAVIRSKDAVRGNLRSDALAISAVSQLAASGSGIVATLLSLNSLRKGNWKAAVPLLTSGVSLLARRGALGPLARGAAVLGVIGAGAYFVVRRRRQRADAEVSDASQ